ncbi:hypothetical protein VPH35_103615 [Triticum aestivum]
MAACAGDPACSLPWRPSLEVNDKLTGRAASRPCLGATTSAPWTGRRGRAAEATRILAAHAIVRGTIPRRRSGARALPEVLAGIVDDAWRGGGEKAWLAVGFRPRRQEPVGAARSGARGGGCSLLPIGSREGDQEQGVDCFLFLDPEEIIRLSLVSVQFIDTLFKGAEDFEYSWRHTELTNKARCQKAGPPRGGVNCIKQLLWRLVLQETWIYGFVSKTTDCSYLFFCKKR